MPRATVTNRKLIRDFGTCLKWTRINTQYVDLGAASKSALSFVQNTGVFSMGCWVKIASFGNQMCLAGNNATSVTEKGFIFSISNNGALRIQLTDGSIATINTGLVTSAPFSKNDVEQWVFVALTGNGSTPTGYIIRQDGVVNSDTFGTISALSSGDSTFNVTLGVCNGASRAVPLDGLMDDFFIENYEMTSAQIQRIAAFTNPVGNLGTLFPHFGFPNNAQPRHRWKFDENTGTNAADSGTGALNGTLNGTVAWSTEVAYKARAAMAGRVSVAGRIAIT